MKIETVRIYADWLGDADAGVNAVLPDVPRDDDEAAPPPVTVLDETRDDAVARGDIPDEVFAAGPVLVLHIYGDLDVAGTSEGAADGDVVQVLVRYVSPAAYDWGDGAGTVRSVGYAESLVYAYRTLQAAQSVISARILALRDAPPPPRNGVILDEPPTSVRYAQPAHDDETSTLTLAAVFSQPVHALALRAGL